MDARTWTIEVTERDLDVLRRNMDAMATLVRMELEPELVEDLHQCRETIGGMLERARADGGGVSAERRGYTRSVADVAQLARASACHAEGRGFESHHPL